MGPVDLDTHDVRLAPLGQASDPVREPENLRALRGCNFEHRPSRQDRRIPRDSLVKEGRELHVAQEIEGVVGGRAVGPEPDLDAGRDHRGHRCDPRCELEVADRIVRHAGFELGEDLDVLGRNVDTVGGHRSIGEYAEIGKVGDRRHALFAEQLLHLPGGFRQVDLHRHPEFLGELRFANEVYRADAVRRVGGNRWENQGVVAVGLDEIPLFLEHLVAGGAPGRRESDQRLGDDSPHSGVSQHRADFVPEEVHIGRRGDPGQQLLGRRQLGSETHHFAVDVFLLHRPDVFLEPLFEG